MSKFVAQYFVRRDVADIDDAWIWRKGRARHVAFTAPTFDVRQRDNANVTVPRRDVERAVRWRTAGQEQQEWQESHYALISVIIISDAPTPPNARVPAVANAFRWMVVAADPMRILKVVLVSWLAGVW